MTRQESRDLNSAMRAPPLSACDYICSSGWNSLVEVQDVLCIAFTYDDTLKTVPTSSQDTSSHWSRERDGTSFFYHIVSFCSDRKLHGIKNPHKDMFKVSRFLRQLVKSCIFPLKKRGLKCLKNVISKHKGIKNSKKKNKNKKKRRRRRRRKAFWNITLTPLALFLSDLLVLDHLKPSCIQSKTSCHMP